ncbi:hypothetical protein SAMN04487931_10597 [Desulfobacula phenolica]|uniref:Uncharacterized protein n=1 Tax=Desulfobacula phenolica TaxID=90732 RepID=A0A1H2GAL7_9BACT|nr:hypothetical protein SAMN04487931_10597 [Desulfobacula phenolica]
MKYRWWFFQIIMTLVSVFFLIFGLDLLISAYSLNNPFNFIMTFFAASFIILISLTLMISFLIKMVRVYRHIKNNTNE